MSDQALLKMLATIMASTGFLVAVAQAQELDAKQACPHELRWRPTAEELARLVTAERGQKPNFCNADLSRANLSNANLVGAELNNVNLSNANLSGANLSGAKLNNANLNKASLNNANLFRAELNNAILYEAELNNADLIGAELSGANLDETELKDAQLAGAQLARATYAPASPPPNPYVALIRGLETVSFPRGDESGLVQLRELLQKAGLREGERQVTYAIESGRTQHALTAWRKNLSDAAEGLFRVVAFDWTTAYGLRPSRALILLIILWALLIPVYWGPI
jgi:hypothetical protein